MPLIKAARLKKIYERRKKLRKTYYKMLQKLTDFFISDIYKHKKDPDIPEDVRTTLEETLVKEIEFYEWIKRRLLSQTI